MMEKFEDNLDQLLVLHPGLLFKAAFTCCWPYLASHVWNGTVYLKSLKVGKKFINIIVANITLYFIKTKYKYVN